MKKKYDLPYLLLFIRAKILKFLSSLFTNYNLVNCTSIISKNVPLNLCVLKCDVTQESQVYWEEERQLSFNITAPNQIVMFTFKSS